MSRVAAATMASRVGFPSRRRAVPVVIVYRPVGTEITHGRRPVSSREMTARHFRYLENHRSAGPGVHGGRRLGFASFADPRSSALPNKPPQAPVSWARDESAQKTGSI